MGSRLRGGDELKKRPGNSRPFFNYARMETDRAELSFARGTEMMLARLAVLPNRRVYPMRKPSKRWYLYWVESDGVEDCFVVARTIRSARSIECHTNGFEFSETKATKIAEIPTKVENSYKRQPDYKAQPWPGYVNGKQFFKGLGAHFRTVEKQQEMLLHDVVYSVDEYCPGGMFRERMIGSKAVEQMRKIPGLSPKYDDEDLWNGPVRHLITGLGMCLIRCQQIEHYIAQSFLLGISKKQKSKYETINDLKSGWKKKTFGNMLKCIEEAWLIHPLVKASFEIYLAQRNMLVHDLATSERFDLRTHWGEQEFLAFIAFFDVHSLLVKKAFRSSYLASIDFAILQLGPQEGMPKKVFNKKQKQEISMFFEFFTPKYESI